MLPYGLYAPGIGEQCVYFIYMTSSFSAETLYSGFVTLLLYKGGCFNMFNIPGDNKIKCPIREQLTFCGDM